MFDFVSFIPRAVVQGIPLLLGSTGETITEKSGNLNLGIPGIMYVGGICGVIGSFYYEAGKTAQDMNTALTILIPLGCCLLGLKLRGEGLARPVVRDPEGLAGLAGQVRALGRVDIQQGLHVEHVHEAALLGKILDGLVDLLVDRSDKLFLLLLKLLRSGLGELLDALLHLGQFFLLALADGLRPGATLGLVFLILVIEVGLHVVERVLGVLAQFVERLADLVHVRAQLNKLSGIHVRELRLSERGHCGKGSCDNQDNLSHFCNKFKCFQFSNLELLADHEVDLALGAGGAVESVAPVHTEQTNHR